MNMTNKSKRLTFVILVLLTFASLMFFYGCGDDDSLTSRTEEGTVSLGSFDLLGLAGPGVQQQQLSVVIAASGNNPSCGTTSLDALLSEDSSWNDLVSRIERIGIDQVRYRITRNDTSVEITGSLQMGPDMGSLADVGSVKIPAFATVTDWTALPFVEGGATIVQTYLDNRGSSFTYCAWGEPDVAALSLTIEIQLDINVTVSII
jgi:hypothetical protein